MGGRIKVSVKPKPKAREPIDHFYDVISYRRHSPCQPLNKPESLANHQLIPYDRYNQNRSNRR